MKFEKSPILGLTIFTPEIFHDFRGEYVETYNKASYCQHCPVFVQDDVSISRKNVLRGLHGDFKTYKLIQCLFGEFYLVVVDMRPDSITYKKWEAFTLNDKERKQVLVPPLHVNGHLCLTETCLFSYKQSEYYTGAENQTSVKWNDPTINIFWPINNPILSRRDYA